jgi:hypothetical protein
VVKTYLHVLGLVVSADKGYVMVMGPHQAGDIVVDACVVESVPHLRFLGTMVTADGRFAPWRDTFDNLIY